MTTAEFELLDETEAEQIIRWRLRELTRAGYTWDTGLTVAVRPDIDLHAASALVRRGCPPDLALQILL